MTKKKSGFTLLELLIVVWIVWLLIVILFRAYATVSQVTFRLQQEKNVMQETLFISQILQNFSETSKLDYTKYSDLVDKKGITNRLYLRNQSWTFSVFTTGFCVSSAVFASWLTKEQLSLPCVLVIEHEDWSQIILTDSHRVLLSQAFFKIIPFTDPISVLSWSSQQVFLVLQKPSFWFFAEAYSPVFSRDWIKNAHVFVQQFFNLNN